MFEKIVIATDFSPGSEELFHCLDELKFLGTKELVLVWAVDISVGMVFSATLQKNHLEKLEARKKILEQAGFQVKIEAPIGYPAGEIVASARENNASLILISSRGKNTIRDFFLGSTVSDVIRITDIPTLVERIEVTGENDSLGRTCTIKMSSLLLASDLSLNAHEAEKMTMALSRYANKVIVMSVMDGQNLEEEQSEAISKVKRQLDGLKKECLDACSEVTVRIEEGIASKNIVKVAEEEKSTLVIMGMRGKGKVTKISLGSTAEAVARLSKRPVLLVPNAKENKQ